MRILTTAEIPKDNRTTSRLIQTNTEKDLTKTMIVTRQRRVLKVVRLKVDLWTKIVIVRHLDEPNTTLVWSTERFLGTWTPWEMTLNRTGMPTVHLEESQLKDMAQAMKMVRLILGQTKGSEE